MAIPFQGRSEEPVSPYVNALPGLPQYPNTGTAAGVVASGDAANLLGGAPVPTEEEVDNACGCSGAGIQNEVSGIPAKLIFAGHAFIIEPEDKEALPEVTFGFSGENDIRQAIEDLKSYIQKNNINVTNQDSFAFFQEVELLGEDSPVMVQIQESRNAGLPVDMSILEMEMFNVKRRDIISFKNFLKVPEKAGEAVMATGGLDKNKKKYLVDFTHEISRDPLFSHPQYDLTYDMLEKSKGAKPKKNEPRFKSPDGLAFQGR